MNSEMFHNHGLEIDDGAFAGFENAPWMRRAADRASLVCYAGETTTAASTTSIGTSIASQQLDPTLFLEFREAGILLPAVSVKQLVKGSLTAAWVTLSTTVSMTAITSGTAEADAITPTTLVTAAPSATAATKAAAVLQSWMSEFGSVINWPASIPGILGRAAAQLMETDVMALCAGHTNTSGDSGVDCTMDNLRTAHVTLRTAALGAASTGAAFYLHDQQVADVDAELLAGTGTGLNSLIGREDVVNWYGSVPGSGMMQNYRGRLFGSPVFQSTLIPNANGSADHGGSLAIPSLAYGVALAWGPRISSDSQSANFKLADSALVSCCYGVVEIKDLAGVSVITDHS